MLLRQIFIQLLVFTVLFNNIAWAVDDCVLIADPSVQNTSQALELPADNNPASDKGSCNRACIGWANLFYMQYQNPVVTTADVKSEIIPYFSSFYFFQDTPPIRPPKVLFI